MNFNVHAQRDQFVDGVPLERRWFLARCLELNHEHPPTWEEEQVVWQRTVAWALEFNGFDPMSPRPGNRRVLNTSDF